MGLTKNSISVTWSPRKFELDVETELGFVGIQEWLSGPELYIHETVVYQLIGGNVQIIL
jgi:hypothetical protein